MILDDLYNILLMVYNVIISLPDVINIIYNIVSWIMSGIINVISYITLLYSLLSSLLGLITGFMYDLFSANPSAVIVFGLITTCISIIALIRIWNIIADIELWGFKLPKL